MNPEFKRGFMYADKDRQREAVRLATRRYRERKGITMVSHRGAIEAPPSGALSRDTSDTPIIPEMPSAWGGPSDYEAWSPVPKSFVVDDKADSVDRPLPSARKRIVMKSGMPCVVEG